MPYGLKNRGELPPVVQDEFENLIAHLRGFLSVSFNDDGTPIAAPSVPNIPIGGVVAWTTSTAPTGYLLCDGNQVSRATFKPLFDVIGTTYGAGDGSTTFHLPNLKGRFPLGKADAGTGSTLAGTFGSLDHTHTAGAVSGSTAAEAAHTHSISSDLSTHDHSISSSGTHTHGPGGAQNFTAGLDGSAWNFDLNSAAGGDHNHGGATGTANLAHSHGGATGAGSSHSHGAGTLAVGVSGTANAPCLVLQYIIKH